MTYKIERFPIVKEVRRCAQGHEVFLSFDTDAEAVGFWEWLQDRDTVESFKRHMDEVESYPD